MDERIGLLIIGILFLIYMYINPYKTYAYAEPYAIDTGVSAISTNRNITQVDMNRAIGSNYAPIVEIIRLAVLSIVDHAMYDVIDPCMSKPDGVQCILSFKHYKTDVLNKPLYDASCKIKDIVEIEMDADLFKQRITQTFVRVLNDAVSNMAAKYKDFGFMRTDFRKALEAGLNREFLIDVVLISKVKQN